MCLLSFLSTCPAPPGSYTLSLHDALPICPSDGRRAPRRRASPSGRRGRRPPGGRPRPPGPADLPHHDGGGEPVQDRKSTRLNSSHITISYAVFCLKKKKNKPNYRHLPPDR